MDVDPVASMRCWAIEFSLGGREFEIPAMPAADWWPVLISGQPSTVLDLLKSGLDDPLNDLLLTGEVNVDDLRDALTEAVEQATGRSFHVAFVLATVGNMVWPMVGGHLAQRGFRWDVQPIGAALDAVYAVMVAHLEDKVRDKFLALLENESLTGGKPSERQREKVTAEFEAMAGPRPAPAPVPGRSSAELSGSARPRTRTRPRQPHRGGRSAAPTSLPSPPAESGPVASS